MTDILLKRPTRSDRIDALIVLQIAWTTRANKDILIGAVADAALAGIRTSSLADKIIDVALAPSSVVLTVRLPASLSPMMFIAKMKREIGLYIFAASPALRTSVQSLWSANSYCRSVGRDAEDQLQDWLMRQRGFSESAILNINNETKDEAHAES